MSFAGEVMKQYLRICMLKGQIRVRYSLLLINYSIKGTCVLLNDGESQSNQCVIMNDAASFVFISVLQNRELILITFT